MNEVFSFKRIKKVLIIDDDEDDSFLLSDAINEMDQHIQCTTLLNGLDAIDYLRQSPDSLPDYIFLDLNMPRMDGKSFLKEVFNDPGLKNIPVVVYSTSKLLQDEEETKILGAVHFIIKPYTFETLKQQVKNVFSITAPAETLKTHFI